MPQQTTFLFVLFIVLCVCTCLGEKVAINSPEDFLKVVQSSRQEPFDDEIELNIDLNVGDTLSVPLGVNERNECIPFSGSFNGNGHSIKNISMDSLDQAYLNAGLFCGFKGASIRNLTIDESCSFNGVWASALCVEAFGDINIESVINEASVTGTEIGSGFIGRIGEIQNPKITIHQCENRGSIAVENGTMINAGGFIAHINKTTGMKLEITSSRNSGKVSLSTESGDTYGGGFIGGIEMVSQISMAINTSTNDGNVICQSSSTGKCGGFIGIITKGVDITLEMNDDANSDYVRLSNKQFDDKSSSAGFISYISQNQDTLIELSKCSNQGEIKGTNTGTTSGLIGRLLGGSEYQTNVSFSDCANYGNIMGEGNQACGFFSLQSQASESAGIKTSVRNCLNQGMITTAKMSYGIGTRITTAKDVVSMGSVQGDIKSFLFWESGESVTNAFGLDESCSNCDNSIITITEINDRYYALPLYYRVDYYLNEQVLKENYEMGWDKDLKLGLSIPSSPYKIESMIDWMELATVASQGLLQGRSLDVVIEDNLYFSHSPMDRPWGENEFGECTPFSGTLDGRGHSIKFLTMSGRKSSLFCGLTDATIKNLTFDSSCEFYGIIASALATTTSGEVKIEAVNNKADVYGNTFAAGIVAYPEQESKLFFLNCRNEGFISSYLYGCGLTCADGGSFTAIFNSINKGNIKGDEGAYGFCIQPRLADNVVNLGTVSSQKEKSSFWKSSTFTDSVFGEFSNCVHLSVYTGQSTSCFESGEGSISIFTNKGGWYDMFIKNNDLPSELNANVRKMNYGLYWTKELDFNQTWQETKPKKKKDGNLIGLIIVCCIAALLFIALIGITIYACKD